MNHDQITLLMEWANLSEEVRKNTELIRGNISSSDSVYNGIKEALEWWRKQTELLSQDGILLGQSRKLPLISLLSEYESEFGNVSSEMKIVANAYDERKIQRRRIGAIKRSLLATGRALNKHSIIAKLT